MSSAKIQKFKIQFVHDGLNCFRWALWAFMLPLTICLFADHQVINKNYTESSLYPVTEPFHEGYLNVSDGHSLYFAQFGNPKGIPVVLLHGGPGSQCHSEWTAFFNSDIFHVIMFDQRGGGRSQPFASMDNNTPHHTLSDMEQLRKHLSIDQWILFGGSYGSFLSVLYGEAYPENCLGFVLRGVFTGREQEYNHLFYGMKSTYPEAWEKMVEIIPEGERSDLIKAFHTRVMDPDPCVHLPAAKAFMYFDTLCAFLLPNNENLAQVETNITSTLGIGRAFIHYAANGFFVEENQILNQISKISHLPAIIVQGRYDIICPPSNAFDLYKNWSNAQLWFIPDAGHAGSEVGISQALREAMDELSGSFGA